VKASLAILICRLELNCIL